LGEGGREGRREASDDRASHLKGSESPNDVLAWAESLADESFPKKKKKKKR